MSVVDQEDVDGFRAIRRVLDGQPLVEAEVDIAFSKTVVIGRGRSNHAQHVGAAHVLQDAPVAIVVIPEEHLAFNEDIRARRSDLGGNRVTGSRHNRVDVPDRLRIGSDGDRVGFGRAIGELQIDGHAGRLVSGVNVRDHEILLELTAGVAFGKQPVFGEVLHAYDIRSAGDDASIAAVDVTEVGGAFDRHRLRRGYDRHRATGEDGGEDGAARSTWYGGRLRRYQIAASIVLRRHGSRLTPDGVQDSDKR